MAIYDPRSDHDLKKAKTRLTQLVKKGKPFKIEEITKRSLKSNAKLHVLLSYLALELGYTLAYTKLNIWKMKWCRSTFYIEKVNEKNREIYHEVRSSADLTDEEMSHCIGILIEKSLSECNITFPNPNSPTYDSDMIMMQKEIYQNEKYI